MDNDLMEIFNKVYQKILKEFTIAYQEKSIEQFLKKYGLDDISDEYFYYESNSKILVIGDSQVNCDILMRVAKHYGISESQIEFILDYDKLKHYNFEKLKCNTRYSDILVGPIAHKVKGIENCSSFLAMVEANPKDYPKVIRLNNSNGLKITKTSFQEGLEKTRLYCEMS